jgi:septal ring factor EnvC (AmiA/AmiB activator)
MMLFTVLSLAALCNQASGQSREELEKQKRQIQQEIDELQQAQSAIKKDKKASLGQLTMIQSKIRKRNAVIGNINSQVSIIDNNINANTHEIVRLKRQLDTLRAQYGKTIEYAYKNRSSYDMLNFIFSASSFNDAIRRVSYLKSYRSYRDQQVATIHSTSDQLSGKIKVLSDNKKEKSQVLQEQTKQMKILETEKQEQSAFVSKLKSREKELEKEMASKKRVERNLQNAIATVIQREIAAANAAKRKADEEAKRNAAANAAANTPAKSANTSSANAATAPNTPAPRKYSALESTPEATEVSLVFEKNRHKLPWPVDKAQITAPFGKRKIEGTTLIEDNIGITIATVAGASVKAVFQGTVSSIFDVAGSQTVTIKHGKYFTTYYNLTGVTVSKGQEVKMGHVIGRAGTNDDGEGEILFVVNVDTRFDDPENWLKSR